MNYYIEQWQRDGGIWARESDATATEIRQADQLFLPVLARLDQLDQLEQHKNPRRIWDYCVGNVSVDDVIDEL
jgi:hypothetical protein